MMDIGPTILELAGVARPASMEAQSLAPALTGSEWAGRNRVFSEHGRDGILREAEFMTMVRTRDWKLVHFLDAPYGQLFDLANDPTETHNLWDEPRHRAEKDWLLEELREWRMRSAYQTRKLFEHCR